MNEHDPHAEARAAIQRQWEKRRKQREEMGLPPLPPLAYKPLIAQFELIGGPRDGEIVSASYAARELSFDCRLKHEAHWTQGRHVYRRVGTRYEYAGVSW